MSVQTSYNFYTSKGVAGGLYDLSHHVVDTFRNADEDGVIKFGVGVYTAGAANKGCVVSNNHDDATDFAGVVVNGFTTEMDMDGNASIKHGATVGVLTHGKVWVRLKEGVTPAYGMPAYVYLAGDENGFFCTSGGDNTEKINGRFVGERSGNLAPIELF